MGATTEQSGGVPLFYILSLKWTRRTEDLVWWSFNRCGYTRALERAGRYTAAEVREFGLDNGESTVAIPVESVEAQACRVVCVDRLSALGIRAHQTASGLVLTPCPTEASGS